MSVDVLYWYCPDCGAKGYVRTNDGDPSSYDTLFLVGVAHRRRRAGECVGIRILTGNESVWPVNYPKAGG